MMISESACLTVCQSVWLCAYLRNRTSQLHRYFLRTM